MSWDANLRKASTRCKNFRNSAFPCHKFIGKQLGRSLESCELCGQKSTIESRCQTQTMLTSVKCERYRGLSVVLRTKSVSKKGVVW